MSDYARRQAEFAQKSSLLISYAFALGHKVTYGEAYRHPSATHGHPHSLHRDRMALDLNLFIDEIYQRDSSAHEPLGVFWESLGGAWGGRFKGEDVDGNHYSLPYGGMR